MKRLVLTEGDRFLLVQSLKDSLNLRSELLTGKPIDGLTAAHYEVPQLTELLIRIRKSLDTPANQENQP